MLCGYVCKSNITSLKTKYFYVESFFLLRQVLEGFICKYKLKPAAAVALRRTDVYSDLDIIMRQLPKCYNSLLNGRMNITAADIVSLHHTEASAI